MFVQLKQHSASDLKGEKLVQRTKQMDESKTCNKGDKEETGGKVKLQQRR